MLKLKICAIIDKKRRLEMGIRDFKIPKMKFNKMNFHTYMLEEIN